MGHPNRFFIVNDVDRPDERHVVERFSGQKAAYIHPDLIHWNKNNGFFQIVENGCTDIENFGFSIDIYNNKIVFRETQPSVATYTDGSCRNWQGKSDFILPVYGSEFVKKSTIWQSEFLPGVTLSNSGGNVYEIFKKGVPVPAFVNYDKNKDRVAKQWFIDNGE